METSTVYQKPSWAQYAIYFVLLLLALLILVHFWIGRNWFKTYAQMNALDKLSYARIEAITTVFRTLNERSAAPGLWMLSEEGVIDKKQALSILEKYPEAVEMGVLKKGAAYSSIASKTGSEEIRKAIAGSAAAFYDSAKTKKTQISVFDYRIGRGIMIKRHQMKLNDNDYSLYFFEKDEDIYVTVTDLAALKGLLPEIMEGMKKYHWVEFERYFGRYPGEFSAVVTFSDKDKQDFFTFGKPHGDEWKDESWDRIYSENPIMLYEWYIHLRIFTGDRNLLAAAESGPVIKPGLPWTVAADWFRVVELIIGALAILILGHFSPWMHGYKRSNK